LSVVFGGYLIMFEEMSTRCLQDASCSYVLSSKIVGVIYFLSLSPRDLQMFMLVIALTIMETCSQYFPMRHQKPATIVAGEFCRKLHHTRNKCTPPCCVVTSDFFGGPVFVAWRQKQKSSANSFTGFSLKKCAKISRF
jgi:hypothetical protein